MKRMFGAVSGSFLSNFFCIFNLITLTRALILLVHCPHIKWISCKKITLTFVFLNSFFISFYQNNSPFQVQLNVSLFHFTSLILSTFKATAWLTLSLILFFSFSLFIYSFFYFSLPKFEVKTIQNNY